VASPVSNIDWDEHRHLLDHWFVSPEFFEWKSSQNSVGPGYVHVELQHGQVVGTCCVSELDVLVGGEPARAAQIGDAFTHPDFRRQGVYSRCVRACTTHCLEHDIDVIYGTPNDQSLRARQNLDYPIARGADVRQLVKVLDPQLLSGRLAEGRLHLPRPFRDVAALAAQRIAFRPVDRSAGAGIEVRVLEDAQPLTGDGLWGKRRTDFAFFARRTSDFVRWRFFRNPMAYRVLAAFDQGSCVGYAAVVIDHDHRGANLVDIVAQGDERVIHNRLLAAVEDDLRETGIGLIRALCSSASPYYRLLRDAGFARRRGDVVVIISASTRLAPRLLAAIEPWHFMLSDTDGPTS